MRLHDLKPAKGATKRSKRLGRGESSGQGKTAGRGHKGQKARSGPNKKSVFEGGQLPLYRRLPKRGFNNAAFHKCFAPVNVGTIEKAGLTGDVDETVLRERGLVNGNWEGIKILGTGDITAKVNVKAHRISEAAQEKIEKAGGSVELVHTVSEAYNKARAKKPKAKS